MAQLTIVTFNVLAPRSADPNDYNIINKYHLDTTIRRKKILNFLTSMKDKCDIIALQEVTHDTIMISGELIHPKEGEYNHFVKTLYPDFIGVFYPHDVDYWDEWKTYDPSSPYSYVQNGNALFFKLSSFKNINFTDLSLKDGNHAVKGEATHIASNREISIINLHLDGDSIDSRINELTAALQPMSSCDNSFDLIVGDFNTGTEIPQIKNLIDKYGFTDAIIESQELSGKFINVPTYPLTEKEIKRNPVDHILYRGTKSHVKYQYTKPLDQGIWEIYPKTEPDIFQHHRLNAILNIYGSDHIPVKATFCII